MRMVRGSRVTVTRNAWAVGLAVVVLLLFGYLAGCSRSERPAGKGRLTVSLHDQAPEDVDQLMVRLSTVSLRSAADGSWTVLPATPAPFDLLTLRDGRTLNVVTAAEIPAGDYDQLRFVFAEEPVATVDSRRIPVNAPSATTSGYKIDGNFSISTDLCTRISLDFDGRQSLRPHRVHGFVLHPVIRLETAEVAICSGEPMRTPEETLEAFIQALEANDVSVALTFFSNIVRFNYEELYADIDLVVMAADLRTSPPVRLDDPILSDDRANFLIRRTVDGESFEYPISLHIENGEWKFLHF